MPPTTRPRTRIAAVEVPPAADDAFLEGRRGGALHRALRADVALRFVEFDGPARAGAGFPAHAGVYEIVEEAGEPARAGGVLLISFLAAGAGEDERLVAAREEIREAWSGCRGQLGMRLYRDAGDADFRFVEVTRWSSPLMYARALREPAVAAALGGPFAGRAALYLPV